MSDNIQILLETSDRLNSKTISLTRCLILTLLSYFVDGVQYRELKAALRISDGKLISNLNQLRKMGYIQKSAVKLEHKKLDVYLLTTEGRKELEKIIKWTDLIKKVAQVSDENAK